MWEEKMLRELCAIPTKNGLTRPRAVRGIGYKMINMGELFAFSRIGDIPMERVKMSEEEMVDFGIETGDLLFARQSLVAEGAGQCSVAINVNEPTTFESHLIRVRLDKKVVNPFFYYYYFSSAYGKQKTQSLVTQVAAAGIKGSDLQKLKIPVPPLPTQQKIADILSAYDDLIENNNRRIGRLEQTAQQLYKEWFVRFRFPGYETAHFTKGIPDGWEIVKLGKEINITSSKRIFLSDYVENGVPFYRSREVIQLASGKAIKELLFIEEEKYLQIKTRFGVPIKNDILLTSVGTIGISLLVNNDNPFYFKDGNLTWLQSSQKPLFALYVYLWLNSDTGKQQILASTIGTSQSALTIESLNKVKLIKPDNAVLREFSEIITPINTQLDNLRIKNQNLIKQRDLLLPRLMSGKIEV